MQGGEDKVCWHVSDIQWFHANLFFPRRAQVSLEPLGDVRNHHQSYLPTYLLVYCRQERVKTVRVVAHDVTVSHTEAGLSLVT